MEKWKPFRVENHEEVAKLSVEEITKNMQEMFDSLKGDYKSEITALLDERNFSMEDLAFSQKIDAIWETCAKKGRESAVTMTAKANEAVFKTKAKSALEIIDIVNQLAHYAHNVMLESGNTFDDMKDNYGIDDSLATKLYTLALKKTEMFKDFCLDIGEELRRKPHKKHDASKLIRKALPVMGEYYMAQHIVQSYAKHAGMPKDEQIS